MGVCGQTRGHDHLGAVGRLDGEERLPGPQHELLQPLRLRRLRAMDVLHDGGHRHRGPGLPADPDSPAAGRGITWVKASYDSIRGRIATSWKLEGGRFLLDATIPANTMAAVYVPTSDAGSVTENGQPAAQAEGVRFLRAEAGAAIFEVGSGHYRFVARSERPHGGSPTHWKTAALGYPVAPSGSTGR